MSESITMVVYDSMVHLPLEACMLCTSQKKHIPSGRMTRRIKNVDGSLTEQPLIGLVHSGRLTEKSFDR